MLDFLIILFFVSIPIIIYAKGTIDAKKKIKEGEQNAVNHYKSECQGFSLINIQYDDMKPRHHSYFIHKVTVPVSTGDRVKVLWPDIRIKENQIKTGTILKENYSIERYEDIRREYMLGRNIKKVIICEINGKKIDINEQMEYYQSKE